MDNRERWITIGKMDNMRKDGQLEERWIAREIWKTNGKMDYKRKEG